MEAQLNECSDLEIFEEFVRRIKSKPHWDYHGMKIDRQDNRDSIEFQFSCDLGDPGREKFTFMFGAESYDMDEIIRIWGWNSALEWMK